MTQLSGGPLAIENQEGVFILRQFVGHFIKLAVGDINGRRDVPFVKFGFCRP